MEPRRVPINWDDLEIALTALMDEWAYCLDLRTGETLAVRRGPFRDEGEGPSEEELDARLAEGTLVLVEPLPSSSVEYGWMAEFAASVAEPRLRELLGVALHRRGAFGRFKRVLSDHPAGVPAGSRSATIASARPCWNGSPTTTSSRRPPRRRAAGEKGGR